MKWVWPCRITRWSFMLGAIERYIACVILQGNVLIFSNVGKWQTGYSLVVSYRLAWAWPQEYFFCEIATCQSPAVCANLLHLVVHMQHLKTRMTLLVRKMKRQGEMLWSIQGSFYFLSDTWLHLAKSSNLHRDNLAVDDCRSVTRWPWPAWMRTVQGHRIWYL